MCVTSTRKWVLQKYAADPKTKYKNRRNFSAIVALHYILRILFRFEQLHQLTEARECSENVMKGSDGILLTSLESTKC